MDTNEKCQMCKGTMKQIGTKIVSDSEYIILQCEKCHHQIARRV